MRAAYTAGVLDAFLDEGILLPYVIGVSAGANAGSDYVARQRERNHKVFVDFVADRRYAGPRNLLSERSWFGMDFLFETLPDELAPFNYQIFKESSSVMTVAVTDCATVGLPTSASAITTPAGSSRPCSAPRAACPCSPLRSRSTGVSTSTAA